MKTHKTPPLLLALIDELPPPSSEWPVEKRARWLETAVAAMALLYGGDPDDIEIAFAEPTRNPDPPNDIGSIVQRNI